MRIRKFCATIVTHLSWRKVTFMIGAQIKSDIPAKCGLVSSVAPYLDFTNMLQNAIAVAGVLATLVGVYVTYISGRGQSEYIKRLAEIKERRALTDLEQTKIKATVTIEDQIEGTVEEKTADFVNLSIIYPGDIEFRNRDEDYTTKTSFTYHFSAIRVSIDGVGVGAGAGDKGFRLETEIKPGYHVLSISWEGEKEGYSEYAHQNKTKDMSGRRELAFWLLRKQDCQLFLTSHFSFDHAAPDIIYPLCYGCKMPGLFDCVSGVRFCSQHSSLADPERVSALHENLVRQSRLKSIQRVLFGAAAIAGAAYLITTFL